LRYHFDEETLQPIPPKLKPGEKVHIPVVQDESIFRSNELQQRVWSKDGKLPLCKKGQGRSIHVSDFNVELMGQLRLSDVQIEAQKKLPESECIIEDACEIIFPGKNVDGWWNAKWLIDQVSIMNCQIRKAQLTIIEGCELCNSIVRLTFS
jgi:hypothetical protein